MGKGMRLGTRLPMRRQPCHLERMQSVAPCRELGLALVASVCTHVRTDAGARVSWELGRHSAMLRERGEEGCKTTIPAGCSGSRGWGGCQRSPPWHRGAERGGRQRGWERLVGAPHPHLWEERAGSRRRTRPGLVLRGPGPSVPLHGWWLGGLSRRGLVELGSSRVWGAECQPQEAQGSAETLTFPGREVAAQLPCLGIS